MRMEGPWYEVLRDGLRLNFKSLPGGYRESNNQSALNNLPFVREKVSEWAAAGHVLELAQPAWCSSPLTVVQKFDPVTDKLKERLVLDMSRHVNNFIADNVVKLDDLSASEHLLDVDDYMTSFDLKNQFFHIKLHPDYYKYFGFSVPDEHGVVRFYCFTVLIYGCKPAVSIVTNLIKPLKGYLHALGIKLSVFIDDGRISAVTVAETKAKTSLVLTVFQLAGWNMQWSKCVLTPTKQLLHLGFITDTVKMMYTVPKEKIDVLVVLLQGLIDCFSHTVVIHVKKVAIVLGKLNAMSRSHGDILRIMSRSSQHELGIHVMQNGWDSYMYVTHRMVTEFRFILNCVYELNGHHIFTAASISHMVDFVESAQYSLEVQHSASDIPNLFVSDASESHAFVYCADGTFAYVSDFEFSAAEANLSSGHRELLSIVFALETHPDVFCKFSPGKIFWQTDSKNVFNFLRRGSRKMEIQADVVKIKKLEKILSVKIVPVWTPREHARLQLADLGSKFSTSTDEWSVVRPVVDAVLNCINVKPTIDAFASVHNKICDRFFSLIPQTGASGVNFFAQSLCTKEVYFCCPPISQILPCFKKLISQPGLTAILLVPDWKSHVFYPYLFNGHHCQSQIQKIFPFQPTFSFSNMASSTVFSKSPKFRMFALLIKT